MASKVTRLYTGLAGLPRIKDAPKELAKQYEKTLRALAKLPQESKYRMMTENYIKEKQAILESSPDRDVIEQKLGGGACEEWLERAQAEHQLVDTMAKYKAWEPLEEKPPSDQWKWPL